MHNGAGRLGWFRSTEIFPGIGSFLQIRQFRAAMLQSLTEFFGLGGRQRLIGRQCQCARCAGNRRQQVIHLRLEISGQSLYFLALIFQPGCFLTQIQSCVPSTVGPALPVPALPAS